MKKTFKGQIHKDLPVDWDVRTRENTWISSEIITCAGNNKLPFHLVTHPSYSCCEYKQALNIFSFGKLHFNIPFTVIAPPISVDACGFVGDSKELIADYKNRKGLFLMLNMKTTQGIPKSVVSGRTLSTAVFLNRYQSFGEFLSSIRSSYRRRINQASKRGMTLKWQEIEQIQFDEKLYSLYLEVLRKSKYPLETLSIEFFQRVVGQIFVLSEGEEPLAFILVKWNKDHLHFLFGGMNYEKRDVFDLYYNMLLKIQTIGIEGKAKTIDFGQTAESSKCRIGCYLEDRYMVAFSGNPFLNLI